MRKTNQKPQGKPKKKKNPTAIPKIPPPPQREIASIHLEPQPINIAALNIALVNAILHDSLPYVDRSINDGAVVDTVAGDPFTIMNKHSPLYLASHRGKKPIVERILKASKATINFATTDGSTPLHAACQQGHTDIVPILIEAGAKTDIADKDGETPLFVAAGQGHEPIVEVLLKTSNPGDKQNARGTSPLFIACQNGHTAIVILLVRAGVNIDLANKNGNTPLHVAAVSGHADIVNLLLTRGANDSLRNTAGKTAYECSVIDNSEKLNSNQRESVIAALKGYKAFFHYRAKELFSMWDMLCSGPEETDLLTSFQNKLRINGIEQTDETISYFRDKLTNNSNPQYKILTSGLSQLRDQLLIYIDEYSSCKANELTKTPPAAAKAPPPRANSHSPSFLASKEEKDHTPVPPPAPPPLHIDSSALPSSNP
jgi:hypothetical protein